ncbi:hypothetical protein CYMTET_36016 [Cymbomonas tetramitiformis]|uniref:WSC domain-containing protein n=1 Tax=Cymbomonas tetramitiformis TaxID=36881 RepID=A0AAE0F829_9CHLO|nr:hypothetical protein CYMTET_36016 [Cymbomonas tetramitiformis]
MTVLPWIFFVRFWTHGVSAEDVSSSGHVEMLPSPSETLERFASSEETEVQFLQGECVPEEFRGDLCCGPRGINYTISSCNEQCSGYSYFALEANGVCTCDNVYLVPDSLVEDLCQPEQLARCSTGKSDSSCTGLFAVTETFDFESPKGNGTSGLKLEVQGSSDKTEVKSQPMTQKPLRLDEKDTSLHNAERNVGNATWVGSRSLLSHAGQQYYTTCQVNSAASCGAGTIGLLMVDPCVHSACEATS